MSPPPSSSHSSSDTAEPPGPAFSALRTAAYCPRKQYYERRDDDREREPPPSVQAVRDLAFRYESVLECPPEALVSKPIAVNPASFQERLAAASHRERVSDCDPRVDRDVYVRGRRCHGIVHKRLTEPLAPSLISSGRPPETGVWKPQSVHAVGAAKALAWEAQTPVDHAYLEYPAYGVIRRLELTTRRKAQFRRALRTVEEMDGPPARVDNRAKCEACEYADQCGVRTRTLRSLLGL